MLNSDCGELNEMLDRVEGVEQGSYRYHRHRHWLARLIFVCCTRLIEITLMDAPAVRVITSCLVLAST